MSTHTEKVIKSIALSRLKSGIRLVKQLKEFEWKEEINAILNRIDVVFQHIIDRLRITDRNLIPAGTLNELADLIQPILDSLQESVDSEEILFDVDTSNDRLDRLLVGASYLPIVRIRTTNEVLQRVADSFHQETKSSIDAMGSTRETMEQESGEIRETYASIKEEIRGSADKLEQEVTSIQENFRSSQEKRNKDFQDQQSEREEKFYENLNPVINEVESYRKQAKEMLEEVAGATSAAHYTKQRNTQKLAADRWRRGGVGALLLLFSVAAWFVWDSRSTDVEFSAVWLITRSSIIITLGTLVAYTWRQSGQHRRREEQIDRVASELILLWPFVNRLPDKERLAVILHVAPLYFKGGFSMGTEPESSGDLMEMLKSLREEYVDDD